MRPFSQFFLSSLIVAASVLPHAQANSNWFDVEVFIFERQASPQVILDAGFQAVDTTKTIDLISKRLGIDPEQPQVNPVPFKVTSSSASKLTAIHNRATLLTANGMAFNGHINKINKAGEFEKLLHLAWRGRMVSRPYSKPIRIYGGQQLELPPIALSPTVQSIDPYAQQQTLSEVQSEAQLEVQQVQSSYSDQLSPMTPPSNLRWQLDGSINIYLDHYLYIETDLYLTKNTPSYLMSTQSPYYTVHMRQNKRVKSNTLHYFDHPEFGMLIQIRRLNN